MIVPIASQIGSEAAKWRQLHRPPIFAVASPYAATPDAVVDPGKELQAQGVDAILLDCVGFTERHRQALLPLGLPVVSIERGCRQGAQRTARQLARCRTVDTAMTI